MSHADALICESCGAPLPPTAAGQTVVCDHCGTAHVVPKKRRARKIIASTAAVGSLLTTLIVAAVPLLVVFAPKLATLSAKVPQLPTPSLGLLSLSPEAMAHAEPEQWHPLAVHLGDLSDFDPLAPLPELLAACRVWSPDCELARLYLSHLRADGHLDLVGDDKAGADYRFISPSRQQARARLTEVTEDLPLTGYRVWVRKGQIQAMLDTREVDEDWHPLDSLGDCTPAKLIAVTRADPSVEKRPFYDLRLDWRTRPSGLSTWLWDVTPGGFLWPDTCTPWSLPEARRRAR